MVSLSILGVLHYVKNDVPLIMSHLVPVPPRPSKKWGLCPTNSGFVHALGRNIELKTTHISLFKSSRDVMQINTLSIQLGLGSSLVDWYRDATSVPFGHLLIDLSPRTDDRLRYCTNSGKTPSKFYVPESLKHLTILDDEHTKSLYSPRVPIIFPQVQNSISPIVSKRIYSVSRRVHSKHTQRKLAKRKKTSRYQI